MTIEKLDFRERLKLDEPIVLPGGVGSEIFTRWKGYLVDNDFPDEDAPSNSARVNLTHPGLITNIHSDFIEAGAEVVETDTFVGSKLHLAMGGNEIYDPDEVIAAGVRSAKNAVEKSERPVYIAGNIGPSPGALSIDAGGDDFGIKMEEAKDAHLRQAEALVKSGVDFFLVETQFSANEAGLIVDVLRQYDLPIAVNMTYKFVEGREGRRGKESTPDSWRTDWGHSPETLIDVLRTGYFCNSKGEPMSPVSKGDGLIDNVDIIGVNCGADRRKNRSGMYYAVLATKATREALEKLVFNKRIAAYSNAGPPLTSRENWEKAIYDTPDEMFGVENAKIEDLVREGAYLIGGCCGASPAHIRRIAEELRV
jgi:methionine synthase I (cobalamin-dependent)